MNFKVENIDKNFNDSRWLKMARIDLNCIPKMVGLGFDVYMNYEDKRFGRTTPDNVPMFPVSFRKNNYHIWKIINRNTGLVMFRSSYVVDGFYTNHDTFENIDDAVAAYNQNNE